MKNYWKEQTSPIFSKEEITLLYEEVVSSFSFPAIIIPELRRDIFTFPTVFQDILASPHEFSNKSLKIPLQHKLFIIEDTLNTNFRYSHIEFLTKISDCIQKFVFNYCYGLFLLLSESGEILDSYIDYWEKYSMSIKHLNSLFVPITKIMNKVFNSDCFYPKPFSFVKIAAGI